MIKLTKLECEYILETLEDLRDFLWDIDGPTGLTDKALESEEIIRACLANQALEAYKLDDEELEELTPEQYADLIDDPQGQIHENQVWQGKCPEVDSK